MFERRLKILLGILLLITVGLVLRAAQLQVVQGDDWRAQAANMMKRDQLVETVRGSIVDNRGRELALDVACIDACVDYRVIQPEADATWIRNRARERLKRRTPETYLKATGTEQEAMVREEIDRVRDDIKKMWRVLAAESGKTLEEIEDIRADIIRRVEMRRRYLWYRNYELAQQRHEQREPEAWYKQWMMLDDAADAPKIDDFEMSVREQEEAHVVLRAITPEMNIRLGKHIEQYPGLVLRPSTHRFYPYGFTACHVLGRLGRVMKDDLEKDPHFDDELRKYLPNDLIGRTGLESLCDSALRGARGRVVRYVAEGTMAEDTSPNKGETVQTTIDIELQGVLESLFRRATIEYGKDDIATEVRFGAAVVIDVRTSEVRALVSFPTFDLNKINDEYYELASDDINRPLMNRATQAQYEPGSTAKPIVGLGAITAGMIKADETIECTGFLEINGRRMPSGKCWTVKKALQWHLNPAHHVFPIPHPTGFLTFSDAIERSCNIFFEQLAHRMGIEGLSHWFAKFGLGNYTGIGISEVAGRLPISYSGPNRAATAWFAGIGQGQILATPLQMANVAATIARDGIWMRPKLLAAGHNWASQPIDPRTKEPIPDRVDLKLDPAAIAAVKEGMVRVVNSPAGTADRDLKRPDLLFAGKTGTAQVPKYRVPIRDHEGALVRDERGRVQYRVLEPGTRAAPNPEARWYKYAGADESELNHAWFMGFAPAKNPQIAFAVLVEYGGSGGHATAPIVRELIEACIERGYLSREKQ